MEKTDAKKKSESFFEGMLGGVSIVDKARSLFRTFEEAVCSLADRVVSEALRKISVLLLMLSGVVFFLAGLAGLISAVSGIPGMGYMVVGIALVFAGALVSLMRRRK